MQRIDDDAASETHHVHIHPAVALQRSGAAEAAEDQEEEPDPGAHPELASLPEDPSEPEPIVDVWDEAAPEV